MLAMLSRNIVCDNLVALLEVEAGARGTVDPVDTDVTDLLDRTIEPGSI